VIWGDTCKFLRTTLSFNTTLNLFVRTPFFKFTLRSAVPSMDWRSAIYKRRRWLNLQELVKQSNSNWFNVTDNVVCIESNVEKDDVHPVRQVCHACRLWHAGWHSRCSVDKRESGWRIATPLSSDCFGFCQKDMVYGHERRLVRHTAWCNLYREWMESHWLSVRPRFDPLLREHDKRNGVSRMFWTVQLQFMAYQCKILSTCNITRRHLDWESLL
jgi:hypothetical protein